MNKGFSYPILDEEKNDYKDLKYEVNHIGSEDNYLIFEHKVTGNGLVYRLLKEKKAKFVTTSVLKTALYRKSISEYFEEITPHHIKMKIPLLNTSEKMDFYSYIVYVGEEEKIVLSETDGVNDFWFGEEIILKKGMIIARDGWRELQNVAGDLLTVKKDENEKYGFNVTISEIEGGKFIVTMKPDLFEKFKRMPDDNSHKRSLVIHMLCLGFMKLREYRDYNEVLINFEAIKRELKANNINTWEDEEYSPNDIACYFYPHIIGDYDVKSD